MIAVVVFIVVVVVAAAAVVGGGGSCKMTKIGRVDHCWFPIKGTAKVSTPCARNGLGLF